MPPGREVRRRSRRSHVESAGLLVAWFLLLERSTGAGSDLKSAKYRGSSGKKPKRRGWKRRRRKAPRVRRGGGIAGCAPQGASPRASLEQSTTMETERAQAGHSGEVPPSLKQPRHAWGPPRGRVFGSGMRTLPELGPRRNELRPPAHAHQNLV